MEFITDLGQVVVGSFVERVAREFDSDAELRVRLMRYAWSPGVYPLEVAETMKLTAGMCLNDNVSAVYARERLVAFKLVLEMMRQRIRGDRGIVVTKKDERIADNLAVIRSEWLRCSDIRDAVDSMIQNLDDAVYWFNIQMIAGFVQRGAFRVADEFVELCSYRDDGFQLGRECDLVSNFAYDQGCMLFRSRCAPAYEELNLLLKRVPALETVFGFSNEEVVTMGLDRMDRLKKTHEKAKVDQPEPVFTMNAAGILVPEEGQKE